MRYKYDTPSITWKSTGPNHFFFHNKECSLKKKKKQKTIAANWPFRHWRMVESFFFPFFRFSLLCRGGHDPLEAFPNSGIDYPNGKNSVSHQVVAIDETMILFVSTFFFHVDRSNSSIGFRYSIEWLAGPMRSAEKPVGWPWGDLETGPLSPRRWQIDQSRHRPQKKNQKQKMATTSLYLQVPSRTPCGWWPQPPQAKQLQKKTTRLTQPDSDSLSSHWLPPRAIDLPGTRWVVLGFTGL